MRSGIVADRLYLCRHLAGALFERFKPESGLSDLVVMAAFNLKFSVLNHKYWPYVDR